MRRHHRRRGIGACVGYTALAFEAAARIVKGLGASIGVDGALRGRYVVTGPILRVGLSYEW